MTHHSIKNTTAICREIGCQHQDYARQLAHFMTKDILVTAALERILKYSHDHEEAKGLAQDALRKVERLNSALKAEER